MSQDLHNLTVVAVHAHPDDESIWTGLLLAQLARRGARTHVVTCTMGEQGEVIGDYQALVEEHTGLLGGYRIAELERALEALGAQPQPDFLGGVGRWKDSGMAGSDSIQRAGAFANPEDGEALHHQVEHLTTALQRIQPDIVLTYAPDGGYGHPDHIRAHKITHAAVSDGGVPSVKQILWPRTVTQDVQDGMQGAHVPEEWSAPADGDIASVDKSETSLRVQGSSADVATKHRAMRAHATQVWFADGQPSPAQPHTVAVPEGSPMLWALSNLIAQPLLDTECYSVGYTAEGISQDYSVQQLGIDRF